MTKTTLIIVGLVLLLIVGAVLFVVLAGPSKQSPPQQSGNVTLPISGSTGGSSSGSQPGQATMTVTSSRGGTIVTNDFLHNGVTIADIENPGRYVLAGPLGYCLANGTCPSVGTAKNYAIAYSDKDHSFSISLGAEPIGQARLAAQLYLQSTLGISQTAMCNLAYYVSVPTNVNDTFSAENLGFSYCPGAIALP